MSNYALVDDAYHIAAAQYYGSIEHRIEELALARGYVTRNGTVNLNTLSERSGISTSTLWYLLKDKSRFRAINMVTLAKLCWTLGVQPGDLFTYRPSATPNGLGYSAASFERLMGTRHAPHRDEDSLAGSDEGGDEGDSERGTLDLPNPVSGDDDR